MTISSTVTKSGPYSGNDSTAVFAYGFQIFADADLQVIHTDSSDVETVLTLGVDYTVAGAGDAGGGSITYPVTGSPLATGDKLTIISDIDLEQQTDLSNQGGFFPEVHETVFDRLCRMIQQHAEKLNRAVLAPISSSTLPTDLYVALIAAAAAAAASAASAALSYTTFDNRYLGSKSSNPTLLNDGVTTIDASHDGIEFWDSTLKVRKTWNGGTLTWGLTSTSVATNAVDVNIADTGGYYVATNVEDMGQEIGANIGRYASVYMTVGQAISISTSTKLAFDAEYADTDAIHDNATNNSRLTVPAGISLIKLSCNIVATSLGSANLSVEIWKNNTQYETGMPAGDVLDTGITGESTCYLQLSTPPIAVSPGDYFEVRVFTIDTGGCNVTGTDDETWFAMEIIK